MSASSSLKSRLMLLWIGALLVALAAAGLVLLALFERHVERGALQEAERHMALLIGELTVDPAGKMAIEAASADPRFREAYSGLYWQAEADGQVLRSRSLWDVELTLPPDLLADGAIHSHDIKGPRGSDVLALERSVTLAGGRKARVAVALDRASIDAARKAFAFELAVALGVLGLALALAFAAQVVIGLKPLDVVRRELGRIRSGEDRRLKAAFPQEVQPLAEEINLLLDGRDTALKRARGRAADLAHGLKTPLTALQAHGARLRAAGQTEVAAEIETLLGLMRRHVDRELARARIGGDGKGAARALLRPVCETIGRALAIGPHGEGKAFDLDVESGFSLAMDHADLEEVMGNLMENACRHAASIIRIEGWQADDGATHVLVSDDGPGLVGEAIMTVRQRGRRLDESGTAGLGLSLVDEVLAAYGGELQLRTAELGGLAAHIVLPSAQR